jgi:hypothetical protein
MILPDPHVQTQTFEIKNGYIESILASAPSNADEEHCQSETFVAFPAPMILPDGPLCPVSAGCSGFLRAFLPKTPTGCHQILTHPLVIEFCQQGQLCDDDDVLHLDRVFMDSRRVKGALQHTGMVVTGR